MEKRIETGLLFDFYGPLLTGHRQEFLRLYCDEDLSLAEIAQEMGITRQGVHDAVRAATDQLEGYEDKLGMLKRFRQIEEAAAQCRACIEKAEAHEPGALAGALEALKRIEADYMK